MIPYQFNVDIINEFEKTFPSYKLITPKLVINELFGLKENLKGKDRVAARVGLKTAKLSNVHIIEDIPIKTNESVDDVLLRVSKVLATNDINLRKRAQKKGISVVYLRQKKYLAIDGYLE